MPMPIAIASHGALLPTASMEIWPAPVPGLVTHLAGVTNTAPDAMGPQGMGASAAGQSDFAPSMMPLQAMAPPPAGWAMPWGQSNFDTAMMHPGAMAPPPLGWAMPWGQSNFDTSMVPQAMAPPQAAMAMTWGQRTCVPPLSGGDVHAPAPAKRARNPITARLLQDIQALGPKGIRSAGGLPELAQQHGVSGRALTKLVRTNGALTARGQAKIKKDVLELPTKPIPGRLLQELSELGPGGIESAGGVAALALEHGVSVRSLQSYILETGRLTALGQDKINTEVHGLQHRPITARLLQELSALGPVGIKSAGGLGGLALKHGVSVGSLQRLIRESGRLTAKGQDKIKSEVLKIQHEPITARWLQELSELGPDGIQGAGGLAELALKQGVSISGLHQYIRETGRLTASGQVKINSEVLGLRHQPITPQLLQKVSSLGRAGIKSAGGVARLAIEHGVSVRRLQSLILETGRLTALGQNKINTEVEGLATQPITTRLLQELSALAPADIKGAGGVGGLALKHRVSVGTLQKLIRESGSLTPKGSKMLDLRD